MKYLIKESQIDLLNEVERHWMDREDETQYNVIKDMLVSFVMSIFDSYDENNNELVISDTDDKILFSFNKKSGELYYDRELDDVYSGLFPHPIWMRHIKYAMSDAFEQQFPQYKDKVTRVRSAHIS